MSNNTKKMEMSNAIISTFKNNNYNMATALSEYIDNSTQSFFDHYDELSKVNGKPRIDIILDKTGDRQSLYIKDNAFGMEPSVLLESLDIGKLLKKSSRNEFGMGLKTSSFWFCSEWSIYTKTLGSDVVHYVNVKEEEAVKDGYEFVVKEMSPQLFEYKSGTIIDLRVFQKNRRIQKSSLVALLNQLAIVYRRDIVDKGLEIRCALKEKVKGEIKYVDLGAEARKEVIEQKYFDTLDELKPIYWNDPEAIEIDGVKIEEEFSITVNGDDGEVFNAKGKALYLKNTDRKIAGMVFVRNDRVIEGGYDNDSYKPKQLFGAGNSFQSLRLFIVVNVESNWPVTQQKDKLQVSDTMKEEIFEQISKQVEKKVLKPVRNHRVNADKKKLKENTTVGNDLKLAEKLKNLNDILNGSQEKLKIIHTPLDDISSIWDIELTINKELEDYTIKTVLILDTDEQEDWLKIEVNDDRNYTFKMNIAHKFFNPFSEDSNYLEILQRMMFYILFSEILMMAEKKIKGEIEPRKFREFLNLLFKNDVA